MIKSQLMIYKIYKPILIFKTATQDSLMTKKKTIN